MVAKKYLSENYDCLEYLADFGNGYYHEESYLQVVLPVEEASINPIHHHLVIALARSLKFLQV